VATVGVTIVLRAIDISNRHVSDQYIMTMMMMTLLTTQTHVMITAFIMILTTVVEMMMMMMDANHDSSPGSALALPRPSPARPARPPPPEIASGVCETMRFWCLSLCPVVWQHALLRIP